MDRNIIDLPCIFGPIVSDWVLNARGKSGGEGVTGTGQVVYGNQPRWEAALKLSGFTKERVLAWRAIRARMRGRVNVLRVCLCDLYRPTWGAIGLPAGDIDLLRGNGIPHDDDAYFSDDMGYEMEPVLLTAGTLAAGAETMAFASSAITAALQSGNWFSYDDWPYQVTGVDAGDDETTFTFEPPLRRAIPAGSEITLRPTALMVFETDLEGRMPLNLGKRGEADINLVEWVNRP